MSKPEDNAEELETSGLAIAALVPTGGDEPMPISTPLGFALAVFMLVFNQSILCLLGWIKLQDGDLDIARSSFISSLCVGALGLSGMLYAWRKGGVFRSSDGLVLGGIALSSTVVFLSALLPFGQMMAVSFSVFNLLLYIWLARSLIALMWFKK